MKGAPGRFIVAEIADHLDRLGLLNQSLPPALAEPRLRLPFAGPAVTVTGSPGNGPDPDPLYAALDAQVAAGTVLVIAAGGWDGGAVFGETRGAALRARGAAGVVVDGLVRDVDALAGLGLPILCRGTHPARFGRRWRFAGPGLPVSVGGVAVRPGDWIVSDSDGAVVVPAELVGEVLG